MTRASEITGAPEKVVKLRKQRAVNHKGYNYPF